MPHCPRYAALVIFQNDIERKYRKFLETWAKALGVTLNVLLKRILFAAIKGEHYTENMPS